ncbi:MAG: hypothetical protein ACE5GJ_06935 [Gemmatimonadota bacterium]
MSSETPGTPGSVPPGDVPSEDVPPGQAPDDDEARVSRVEERERLLAEALAHVTAQDLQYSETPLEERRPAIWKGVLALLLLAAAAYAAVLPPAWLPRPPVPAVTQGDREIGVRAALFLQAQAVEGFRVRELRLPGSLEEVGRALPDITFVRSNNRVYQLVARRPNGRPLVYDSAHPDPGFEAVGGSWTAAEGRRSP